MSALARHELWSKAAALRPEARMPVDLPDAVAASPRARALAQRMAESRSFGPPLGLDDIAATPDWAGWTTERRRRLARLAGAVAVSQELQCCIAGDVLLRAAKALGVMLLDAVLALPADTPALVDARAADGHADALARLGAAVLLAEIERPALRQRLSLRFDDIAPGVRPQPGRAVAGIARRLLAEFEAEHAA